ncbi:hypothetical protein [Nocardia sp. CC227C]|uniref:hypothetical protein n=1 Tax=Nocardia sp. CC227C TaxID=3044562 RepID=UPI00278C224F|nr:hypothetical protein [Nocardia sp. CC227C]
MAHIVAAAVRPGRVQPRSIAALATATAQSEGAISATHARAVIRVMNRLPDAVDTATRAVAEHHLADAARQARFAHRAAGFAEHPQRFGRVDAGGGLEP